MPAVIFLNLQSRLLNRVEVAGHHDPGVTTVQEPQVQLDELVESRDERTSKVKSYQNVEDKVDVWLKSRLKEKNC